MSNPVYGKKSAASRNGIDRSGISGTALWTLAAALMLLLIWSAFQAALFNGQMIDFEQPIYTASLLAMIMFLGWIALSFTGFRLDDRRDLLAACSLLLPLTYALALPMAASRYAATTMLLIQAVYAAVFIIALYVLKEKRLNVAIQNAVLGLSYFIVLFGLLNWLGASRLAGGLVGWFSNTVIGGVYVDAVMTDANGLRLTSIFQYANTYAAFLMAVLFLAVFALIRSERLTGMLLHGFMLVPAIVSLLLTLSRGGLVLLPVIFILLLLPLKPVRQCLWILHLAVAGLISLLITNRITVLGTGLHEAFSGSAALQAWAILIGASAVSAGLSWTIQRYAAPWLEVKCARWSDRRLAGLWIPLGAVALSALAAFLLLGTGLKSILPDNIETRLENINFRQHSVLERFTFYEDAMGVVADYPVLGAGGGSWSVLYEQYQNNPYVSRQVHNFFLQYLIEVGVLGLLVFMAFILYIFYRFLRNYLKRERDDFQNGYFYFILALTILVHSLLDFNMSYVFVGMLVFLGLGGMAAAGNGKALSARWSGAGPRLAYMGTLGVGAAFILFLSINYLSGGAAASEGRILYSTSQSYEAIKTPLAEALDKRPGHPEAALQLAMLNLAVAPQHPEAGFEEEAYRILTETLEREPHNKKLLGQLAVYYDLKGERAQAFAVYRDNAYKFSWDIDWYGQLINRAYSVGYEAHIQKDEARRDAAFADGLDAYRRVTEGVAHLATLPPEQLQGRPFAVTPAIALSAGRMQLISGDPAAAAETLRPVLSSDFADEANRETARWYLAALELSGSADQQLLDQLLAAEPTEQARIAAIVGGAY